jgi:ethanolamine utilization protein EutN/carbon dioxide concentrating mechanism protein CcmL
MQLARVIGSVVSTRKSERLEGLKLLVAVPVDMDTFEEKGAPFVTVDTVGAGEGEIVMWAGGSSSRQTELTGSKPVDSSIIGIVDFVDIRQTGLQQARPKGRGGRAMNIAPKRCPGPHREYEKYRGMIVASRSCTLSHSASP